LERITPFFDRLGLKWDHNFMSDDNRILPSESGSYIVGYGQGGRVSGAKLPQGAQPLLTFEGDVFGFVTNVGKGKLAVVGDAGLVSNGLYHFPGFKNDEFLLKLFKDMSPAWCGDSDKYYEHFEFGHLSCGTSDNGITEKMFKSLRPEAKFEIDHHYRHLTFENKPVTISNAAAEDRLPVKIGDAAGKQFVAGQFSYVNVCNAMKTSLFDLKLNISEKKSETGMDYIISGNTVKENAKWEDIGADPAIFGKIGELVSVNTVVQILSGTDSDGTLKYYTMKQGQIIYIKNMKNAHYGVDILLGSKNMVISPSVCGDNG
jgi:hypothetical protein